MSNITNETEFKAYVESIRTRSDYRDPSGFGLGIRRRKNEVTLDVSYPKVNWDSNLGSAAIFYEHCELERTENNFAVLNPAQLEKIFECFNPFHTNLTEHHNLSALKSIIDMKVDSDTYQELDVIVYFLWDHDQAVVNTEEAYFKLQLISQREVTPHSVNLEGIFGKLNNIAWTNYGPMLPEDVSQESIKYAGTNQPLQVSHVDKFPYLLNYHVPSGVRVAAGQKVRLGAHLAEGTTVMQAGFVNFNAGTLGNAMIEGRVSAGVVVGNNSDVGGSASIMGTLSGGNKSVLAIGENCLLGANAGTGISLGDGSTIAAGLYVTAGAKVSMYNEKNEPVDFEGNPVPEGENITKAIELSGRSNLLFLQDSISGKIICKPNPKTIELNAELHSN